MARVSYHAAMDSSLVFITGASRGIGAAMARAVPYPNAHVIDISRRGGEGGEHFQADLSDPGQWSGVAELFARETKDFEGERVVLVHAAGAALGW